MDGPTKTTQNPTVSVADQTQPVAQPVTPANGQTASQPISPTGSRESGPVLTIDASGDADKPVKETAPEVKLPKEVSEAGVETVKSEVLQVSPDLQQQGVQPVGVAVPVPEEPSIKLPMTEEKAEGILKMHKKIKESVTWLAMLVVRQMQVIRFNKEKKEEEIKE